MAASDTNRRIHPLLELRNTLPHVHKEPLNPILKISIENEGGDVSFFPLSDYTTINTTKISIKNTYGRIAFNTTSRTSTGSWGSWSKLLVVTGAIYCYRHELEILAGGLMAGARFAVEKWGERHVPRTVERGGEEEDEEGGKEGGKACEGLRCEQVSTCSSDRDRRACPLSMTAAAVLEAGVASPFTVGSEWVEDVVCDDAYLEAMSTLSSEELV